jgi:tetratricopeptide (TPR) repeat protein
MKAGFIVFISLASLIVLYTAVQYKHKHTTEPAVAVSQTHSARETNLAQTDLYNNSHPYLAGAHHFNNEKKYDSAILYYKQAAEKFKDEKQWENYVWVNSYIARLYLFVSGKDFHSALPYLTTAIDTAAKHIPPTDPNLAVTLYYFGIYYSDLNAADKSLSMLKQSLAILTKYNSGETIYAANDYEMLADVYLQNKYDNLQAEKYYLASLKIKRALPAEKRDSNISITFYKLTSLYDATGDYDKAQSFCYESMANISYIKNHKSYWMEILEGALASLFSKQQFFQKALPEFKKVISINLANNGDNAHLSFYYNSLGDIYAKTGQYDSAIRYYALTMKLATAKSAFDDMDVIMADTYYSAGRCYLKMEETDLALWYFKKDLNLLSRKSNEKSRSMAMAFEGISNVYQARRMPDSAMKFIQASIAAFVTGFDPNNIYQIPFTPQVKKGFFSFQVFRDKSGILDDLYTKDPTNTNLLKASLRYYQLADTLMSTFWYDYQRDNTKLLFTENNINIYEGGINCAALLFHLTHDSSYYTCLLDFIDRRKSALLLESLDKERELTQSGVPGNTRDARRLLLQQLSFLQTSIEEENSQDRPNDSILTILHSKTISIEEKLTAATDSLYGSNPQDERTRHSAEIVSIAAIKQYSLDTKTVVLNYFWGEESVFVSSIFNGKIAIVKTPRSNSLLKDIDTVEFLLRKGYVFDTDSADFIAYQRCSFQLFFQLVLPSLQQLGVPTSDKPGDVSLVIIPDGLLAALPFEAFCTSSNPEQGLDYRHLPYLLKAYTISYAYSPASLVKSMPFSHRLASPRVLAMSFSKGNDAGSLSGSLQSLRDNPDLELPGSAEEVKAISRFVNGKFYMGEEATESVFKKNAAAFDILHLAVHGEANQKSFNLSRLVFKSGGDSVDDGSLYNYEIYNFPLKARLAVLSACESGIGRPGAGEGMFSTARAFAFAGCPTIINSLWKVNDHSTATIMASFYRPLSSGCMVNESLARAKLDFINSADKRNAHPTNWAAFISIGDISPVFAASPDEKRNRLLLFLSVTILLSVTACITVFTVRKLLK